MNKYNLTKFENYLIKHFKENLPTTYDNFAIMFRLDAVMMQENFGYNEISLEGVIVITSEKCSTNLEEFTKWSSLNLNDYKIKTLTITITDDYRYRRGISFKLTLST